MAGHNKWSKIKHKKGAADAKRGKIWTKIIREITLAAGLGGPEPGSNPRLRKAIDDARSANMPKDNIMRAISKGSGGEASNVEELVYEGYGAGGVAIIVECMTDNRNRTLSEVRTIIQKRGGNLGTPGSVLFGFQKKGQLYFSLEKCPQCTEDRMLEVGLEHGLDDVARDDDGFLVTCAPEAYLNLKEAFVRAGLNPDSSELAMVPGNWVSVSGDAAKNLLTMIEQLEDLDDVQNVYSNMDIDEEEFANLMG